jgi:CheY-like chemotaxis protein
MNEPIAVELLLVEDNPQDLELSLRALRKANLLNHIHVARDGAEALEYVFCEGPHVNRRLEVLKRIKSDPRTKMIPVVVLTSSKEQCDVIESYQIGVNSYIVKPVNFERFAEAVRDLGLYWLLQNQPPKVSD